MTRSISKRPGSFVIIAQVLLWTLAGCVETEEPQEGQDGNLRYRLDENTVWLRPGSPVTVLEQTQTRIVFSELPRGLEVGKVLVSSMGNGALRKVLAIRPQGSTVVVETGPATLTEAFEELDLDLQKPLGRAELGDLVSDVPGVSFEWVQEPSVQSRARDQAASVEFATLKMNFKNAEFSAGGLSVDGEVFLRLHPVLTLQTKPDPGLVPKVETFVAGARPEFYGSLTVSSRFGGSVSADKSWFNKPLAIVVWGPLVFVPKLRISSAISGSANGSFSSTYSLQASAVALAGWNETEGWYTRGTINPVRAGSVDQAKATLEVRADLLTVELRFDLYALAGPYAKASAYTQVSGEFDIGPDSREGVRVTVGGGLSVEAGVSTDFQEMLGADFDRGRAIVSVDAPLVTVFEKFFPYEGLASLVVGDNGTAAEDIFEVELDGIFLGRTHRGGTGQFRATDLRPGRHVLSVTCIDDGWAGADIGTLGISLGDGLTFSDGSQALSDTLFMYEKRTYEVVVPTGLVVEPHGAPPPLSRNASAERMN